LINLYLLIAVTFWGLSFVATKIVLDYLNPFEIIGIRLILGVPVLYFISRLKKVQLKINRSDLCIVIIASIVLGGHFLIQAFGLMYTTATNTAWLIATIPVFTAIAAYFFLKERLRIFQVLGIAVATIGVILLFSRGNFGSLDWMQSIGDWIILSSCLTWTIYTVLTRNIMQQYNPLSLAIVLLVLPTIILLIYLIFYSSINRFLSLPTDIWMLLIFMSIFTLGLAHWLWLEGLSRKEAARTGVFLYFEPIVTTIAAASILGEKITCYLILGALLILGGVYIVQSRGNDKNGNK